MNRILEVCLLTLVLLVHPAGSSAEPAWHDPSPHKVVFATVEEGVRLEVLDWGGAGSDVVLLAGSGNTAHVFDDFAPRLSGFCHVYGITRRGYGTSSHPSSGYSEQRLAQDVLEVIDFLKLPKPILMGHSMSGEEMTRLGDEHSDRLGGLIYLDAASDPTDWPGSSPAYMALFEKLPKGARTPPPEPTDADLKSFHTYYEWQLRNRDTPFPESELRNQFEEKPDGSVGDFRTSDEIHRAIGRGAQKRDYSRIHVPILAFFPLVGTESKYRPANDEEQAAIKAFNDATDSYVNRYKANLRKATDVRIVVLTGANHYVFISNEKEVLHETRRFLERLKQAQSKRKVTRS